MFNELFKSMSQESELPVAGGPADTPPPKFNLWKWAMDFWEKHKKPIRIIGVLLAFIILTFPQWINALIGEPFVDWLRGKGITMPISYLILAVIGIAILVILFIDDLKSAKEKKKQFSFIPWVLLSGFLLVFLWREIHPAIKVITQTNANIAPSEPVPLTKATENSLPEQKKWYLKIMRIHPNFYSPNIPSSPFRIIARVNDVTENFPNDGSWYQNEPTSDDVSSHTVRDIFPTNDIFELPQADRYFISFEGTIDRWQSWAGMSSPRRDNFLVSSLPTASELDIHVGQVFAPIQSTQSEISIYYNITSRDMPSPENRSTAFQTQWYLHLKNLRLYPPLPSPWRGIARIEADVNGQPYSFPNGIIFYSGIQGDLDLHNDPIPLVYDANGYQIHFKLLTLAMPSFGSFLSQVNGSDPHHTNTIAVASAQDDIFKIADLPAEKTNGFSMIQPGGEWMYIDYEITTNR